MDEQLNYNSYKKRLQNLRFVNTTGILLDGIDNIENLGLICRSAESVNIRNIYLYNTPIEIRQRKLRRISRSTSSKLNLVKVNLRECHNLAAEINFIALEITQESKSLYNFTPPARPFILVAGSETDGISIEVLKLCKSAYHLPIMGRQSSINLACSVTSALHWTTHVQLTGNKSGKQLSGKPL